MVAKKREDAAEKAEVKKPARAPAPAPVVPEKNPGEEFVDIEILDLKAVQIGQLGVLIKDGPFIKDSSIARTALGKFVIKG